MAGRERGRLKRGVVNKKRRKIQIERTLETALDLDDMKKKLESTALLTDRGWQKCMSLARKKSRGRRLKTPVDATARACVCQSVLAALAHVCGSAPCLFSFRVPRSGCVMIFPVDTLHRDVSKEGVCNMLGLRADLLGAVLPELPGQRLL